MIRIICAGEGDGGQAYQFWSKQRKELSSTKFGVKTARILQFEFAFRISLVNIGPDKRWRGPGECADEHPVVFSNTTFVPWPGIIAVILTFSGVGPVSHAYFT